MGLDTFVNSSWDTRFSVSGCMVCYYGCQFDWFSKMQKSSALRRALPDARPQRCSVRACVEQVLQQEWRRLMRRESLDTTELANACSYGRWRKFDLKNTRRLSRPGSTFSSVQ